jgi:glycosyltransferase involved in cell wall biosynthesis
MTTTAAIKFLVVIPVYNHADTLRDVTVQVIQTGLDVLVVDDGSTDQGLESLKGIDCLTHTLSPNQGKGAAILAGAKIADKRSFDAIITIDADGQHDPASIQALIKKTSEQWPALIIGNRIMDPEKVPRSSLFGRSFSNFWVRIETGHTLPDTQSGLRLYPVRELLQLSIRSRRYDFEIESLVKLSWAGVPVHSVPIPVYYPPPGERISHFDQLKDNTRLTLLHTLLVTRALIPWPHTRLVKKKARDKQPNLLLHPVKLFKKLLLEHATPTQIATAAWVGIFLGALPLIGIHTIVILYVCHMLHLNKMTAVAASQLCMPPVIPIICIQTGYYLRHGELLLDFTRETLVVQIGERLWEYLLGSLIVGPLLGFVVAAMSYFAIRYFRNWKTLQTSETDSLSTDQEKA